ncbi:ABC transporter ATP-binding protein [Pararobbsia silviterrae]|uniref:ABC transporter ATP-binding protein n=1 Tax=Pararobbsia silviterrae TaxID=1792498 RepID=A0A494XA36_9BURK|nr:ABC transporter ATP-binding protein [Pararobbsia silviterrae]RKP44443.1 ABC transporter ATP-binding protein [Pararobbsia silviterrae]
MKTWEFVSNLREALSLLWRASPGAVALAIISNLVIGLIPAALLYFNAQLIERLTSNAPLAALMTLVVVYFVLGGFQDGLTAISSFIVDTLRDSVGASLKRHVNEAVSNYPKLTIHEDADLRETAILATRASEHIGDLISHLHAVCVGAVMIIPLLVLSGQSAWWIPFLMLAGMVPSVLFRAKAERESWDVTESHATTFNALRIHERILTQPEYAKDLRIYRMQGRILHTWQNLYDSYLASIRHVRLRNALKLAATSTTASIFLGIPLYAAISRYQAGQSSIAQLAFLLGALVQLKDGLAAVIFNFGDLLSLSYSVRPLRKLAEAYERNARRFVTNDTCATASSETPPIQPCVALRNVDRCYPGTARAALDRINLEIHHREVVAVVGENGAGKTTLVKLLSGFYEPTAGELIWSTPHAEPKVVAVFQDFARFPLDTYENLVMNNDRRRAHACLHAVGLDVLSDTLHTPLTTESPDGIDLSGGQWQRLAIARAMIHADDADLLVFDEPTSALDPESEADIMRLILDLSRKKTAIIVSHRLALTRFVDRILVLDQGRLIEDGSHDELMKQGGKYARMFESQAQFYREGAACANT